MKIFKGKVISVKSGKTATVEVERFIAHPVYKKRYKRSKKYQVHSETPVEIGSTVEFVACRPISKTKKHKVIESKKVVNSKTKVSKKPRKATKSPRGKGGKK